VFPKIFSYGDFFLPTYGVLVALAFLAGLWVTIRLGRGTKMISETITNLVVYCALAGLLGAKLLMFAFDWDHFSRDPLDMISISTLRAAGVFQGGLILAILTAFLYLRHQKLALLPTFDLFAPGIALGHAIGRIACFAAGCCYGTECDLPWAVTYRNPEAHELNQVPLYVPLHPSQLYETASNLLLFAFLYWAYKRPHRTGSIIGMYLVISSVARFAIEFTRHHDQGLPFGLPFSITQWIAAGLAVAGAAILWYSRAQTPSSASRPVALAH